PQIKVQFVDVTKEAGITGQSASATGDLASFAGPGACFLDYDGDGKIDIFLPDNGPHGGMALYHNLGGKFEDLTRNAGIDPSLHGIGCTAGDYDNDGATDLAITFSGRVLLLHNQKDGTFKNVTEAAGIKCDGLNLGAVFIDYDHDGDLDLLLAQYSDLPIFDPRKPADSSWSGQLPDFNQLWRNNGDSTFTNQSKETGIAGKAPSVAAIGTDFNNDRAVDIVIAGTAIGGPSILLNPREGKFRAQSPGQIFPEISAAVVGLDFNHDGWMDLALTHWRQPALSLWRNKAGKGIESMPLPATNWVRAFGVAAFDYDNDGWVDLVAVGETKEGKGEVRLFRNLGPDGFKDVTADVGLDKIQLKDPRAIITGDYDNDGATDLLITQNHGPAVLLRNEGGNKNHWLRLALKGLADNKSAIGSNRQKFEIYGSNGYLGQNSPYLTVGLGDAKEADIVRMLWPTGVLEDEIQIAGDKQQDFLEIDRRGSSCPTLFVWNGERYEFVADMLGAGVVGHWVGPGQRDVPRPVEYIKINRSAIRQKEENSDVRPQTSDVGLNGFDKVRGPRSGARFLSLRFMEPLEEAVYLDQVRLLAVDHPSDTEIYPNEYFASNPPYPEFKVVVSRNARPPAGAWDEHGHDVLPDLLSHRYFGDFGLTQFAGFAKTHSLTLDLGEAYRGGPLWLLLDGEVEYFSANSMYAASQAGLEAMSPYVEALVGKEKEVGKWKRVIDDMGFPAGGPRTMTADLTGKLPVGTRKIRITTNLQIYWDSILINRTEQPTARGIPRLGGESAGLRDDAARNRQSARHDHDQPRGVRLTPVPLFRADLEFHGYPLKIEGKPAGNVHYVYEKASATGPYTRPSGTYTRYGDVLPLLTATDDKLAVFGSGDEVQLDFDPSHLPALPKGWVRDYFFAANGYEKDMDFYAAEGNYVAPLPFLSMGEYPYPAKKSFPLDDAHLNYLLEYNTRHMSGNEQRGYWFDYGGLREESLKH
ncbi:MAG: hypothetical protein DMG79_21805, partial [Acidobacteria bacterium]